LSAEPNPDRHARYAWAAQSIGGGRVLDAGCGSGWGTALLARAAGEAVGVDLSPAAVAEARREHGELARFEEGDLRALPCGDGEFDQVVCFEALTQTAEPEPVLEELSRVLRPGGLLLVSAPNRYAYPPGNPLQLSELSSGELQHLLEARFVNVAVHRQQSYHASLLGPLQLLAHEVPSTPVAATVVKLCGGAPGSELHAVAAASDGDLPAPPAWLVIGEELAYREQQAELAEWRERAVRAEAQAHSLARKLRLQRR
jgi:SAM-dependent methyltransferase